MGKTTGSTGNPLDLIRGCRGDDNIAGSTEADTLIGGAGTDVMCASWCVEGTETDFALNTLRGGPGNDHLWGSAGDDHLYGDDGDDLLHGDEGDDFLSGGPGTRHPRRGATPMTNCTRGEVCDSCEVIT